MEWNLESKILDQTGSMDAAAKMGQNDLGCQKQKGYFTTGAGNTDNNPPPLNIGSKVKDYLHRFVKT